MKIDYPALEQNRDIVRPQELVFRSDIHVRLKSAKSPNSRFSNFGFQAFYIGLEYKLLWSDSNLPACQKLEIGTVRRWKLEV